MNGFYETKDKRDLFLIDLRKDLINEIISKSRTRINLNLKPNEDQKDVLAENANSENEKYTPEKNEKDLFQKLLSLKKEQETAINSSGEEQRDIMFKIVHKVRKLISSGKNEKVPAQEFIDAGLLELFSGLISQNLDENIQAEALHAQSNIMTLPFYELEDFLENTNTIESIVRLAMSQNLRLFDSAIWALTNMFADDEDQALKENLIDYGIVDHVLLMYEKLTKKEFPISDIETNTHITTIIWFLSNLTKGPKFIDVKYMSILNKICEIFLQYINSEGKVDDVYESLLGIDSFLQNNREKTCNNYEQGKRLESILQIDEDFFKNMVEIALIRFESYGQDPLVLLIIDILGIIGHMLVNSKYNLDGMILKTEICLLINKILDSDSLCFKKKAIVILQNLCASSAGIQIAVNERLICSIYKNISEEGRRLRSDFLLVITNLVRCMPLEDLSQWLYDKNSILKCKNHEIILEMILDGLDLNNENWSIYECLVSVERLLAYGKMMGDGSDLDDSNSNRYLALQLSQEKIGNLENQESHDDLNIHIKVKELEEGYFNSTF